MAWVIDTCVLVDIRNADPQFAQRSAVCLTERAVDGLVVAPITLIELAPSFQGDYAAQAQWLNSLDISYMDSWTAEDTRAAHGLWHDHILRKRAGLEGKRPMADVLIAAFALRFQGLISRNGNDFRRLSQSLNVLEP